MVSVNSPSPAKYAFGQTKPLASFHTFFKCRQHALRPYGRFRPPPSLPDRGFSCLFRLSCHCRRSCFLPYVLHASTFLPPFAPHPLRCFLTTTEALCSARSPPVQASLVHVPCLPAIPSPTTLCALSPLLHATPQRDRLPLPSDREVWASS